MTITGSEIATECRDQFGYEVKNNKLEYLLG